MSETRAWVLVGNNTCCGCSAWTFYDAFLTEEEAEAERRKVIDETFGLDESDIWVRAVPYHDQDEGQR